MSSRSRRSIAEGIDDQARLSRLQAERCDVGRGFLFARPMEADQCREFVERWATSGALGRRERAQRP
jgi:EAL domain-containing protein (putative c-di-GMP-specific phosphodiesterase class I)